MTLKELHEIKHDDLFYSIRILLYRLFEQPVYGYTEPTSLPVHTSDGKIVGKVILEMSTLGKYLIWLLVDGLDNFESVELIYNGGTLDETADMLATDLLGKLEKFYNGDRDGD
jgi:hypothetical protein